MEVTLGCEFQSSRSTHSRIQIQPLMTEHGIQTDKLDTKFFKNSGRDLRPKCRECLKLSVRTSLANLDHRTQRCPPWEPLSSVTLARISASFPHQDDRNPGNQMPYRVSCGWVPRLPRPGPANSSREFKNQGRLSSFTESFFLEIDFRCWPQLA